MIKHLKKIKQLNTQARILSLDIGRQFIGCAVSSKSLDLVTPYRVFEINP